MTSNHTWATAHQHEIRISAIWWRLEHLVEVRADNLLVYLCTQTHTNRHVLWMDRSVLWIYLFQAIRYRGALVLSLPFCVCLTIAAAAVTAAGC